MPIPDSDNFECVLSSLTLNRSDLDGNDDVETTEIHPVMKQTETLPLSGPTLIETHPALHIHYRRHKQLSFESLTKKVESELSSQMGRTTPGIVNSILGLFALLPRGKTSAVARFNGFLSEIVPATLSQTYLFPKFSNPNAIDYQSFNIGPFSIGFLNRENIRVRMAVAGCDWFERHEYELRQPRFAVERDPISINLFDWRRIMMPHLTGIKASKIMTDRHEGLITYFFDEISDMWSEDFFNDLMEQQHLLIASGAPHIDPQQLRSNMQNDFLSIYNNIGPTKWGYGCPKATPYATIQLNATDRHIPPAQERLRTDFSFDGYTSSNLSQTLKTVALFMAKAVLHCEDERNDEGFLHFVIALDLLFGDKDSLNSSISRRVAVATFMSMNESFDDQVKTVKRVYDARSRYVHEGLAVSEKLRKSVQGLCKEVLAVLLRLHALEREVALEEWLAQLDYYASALEAGRPSTFDDMESNGISVGQYRVPAK